MPPLNEDQLPHVTSSVERFLANPDGNADGMILANGVEVYFAPHLSTAVLEAIQVGDRITVYGVLPMAEPMIAAVVIEAANGTRIEDNGFDTSAAGHGRRTSGQNTRAQHARAARTQNTSRTP
jgi:hypothetical protein